MKLLSRGDEPLLARTAVIAVHLGSDQSRHDLALGAGAVPVGAGEIDPRGRWGFLLVFSWGFSLGRRPELLPSNRRTWGVVAGRRAVVGAVRVPDSMGHHV